MSRRRPGSQPQAVITHPNDSEIKTTVRKPKLHENAKLKAILASNRSAIQVYARNGEAALDADGSKSVYVEQAWPAEAMIEWLRIHFVSHEGVLDGNGSLIVMTFQDLTAEGEEPTALEYLAPWLNVTLPAEDGQPTPKPISYASFLMQEVAKPETFSANPPAPPSAIT